jgi:hypothetical protein
MRRSQCNQEHRKQKEKKMRESGSPSREDRSEVNNADPKGHFLNFNL